MKFKKGDKVKSLVNNARLTIDKVYEVIEIDSSSIYKKNMIKIIDNTGCLSGWYKERFELVEQNAQKYPIGMEIYQVNNNEVAESYLKIIDYKDKQYTVSFHEMNYNCDNSQINEEMINKHIEVFGDKVIKYMPNQETKAQNPNAPKECTCKHSFLHTNKGCTCGAIEPYNANKIWYK